MKTAIAICAILFLCVGDIFLYRKGLLPLEPSVTLAPVFILLCLKVYGASFLTVFRSTSSWVFFVFFVFAVMFSVFAVYDVFYAIGNAMLSFLVYSVAALMFLSDESKAQKRIMLLAYVILVGSILMDFVTGVAEAQRGAGFAENPNNAAVRVVLLMVVLAFFLTERKQMILLVTLSVLAVFLTLSRSGIILVATGAMLVLATKLWNVQRASKLPQFLLKALPVFAVAALIFISVAPKIATYVPAFASRSAMERISQITGEADMINESDVGDEGRVSIAKTYFGRFKENPLGYGTAASMDRGFYHKATHNMFLRIAIDFGILGLLFLIFFIIRGFYLSFRYDNLYGIAVYVVFAVTCMFTNGLFENRTFLICLAFVDVMNMKIKESRRYA